MRQAEIQRATRETEIELFFCADGGDTEISTGVGFFDHMLNSFALHGGFGLRVRVKGDLHVDCHHTVEDTGIVLGQAICAAVGDKRGIRRFGHAYVPMDEALGFCAVDVGGRAFLHFDAAFTNQSVGAFDTCMTEEFFRALAFQAGLTLHLSCPSGQNDHHKIEALFKAAARALRDALRIEGTEIPSAKGVL